jgi:hypothetical protein
MDDGKNEASDFTVWCHFQSHEERLLFSLRLSFHPSACISTAPTEKIFMKFDLGDFEENMSQKFKFVSNQSKISGTLQEDLSTLYYCRRQKISIKALSSREVVSGS